MTKIHELAELGQSIWLDYIRRDFITSGELQSLIDLGLGGVTSNPTIFETAIDSSDVYTEDLKRLIQSGKSIQEINDNLVVEDIRLAADLLRPVYDRTQGADGFVSLEVNPTLASDTEHTFMEAKRLWSLVDRPNLMVKIPATQAGIPAISQAIAQGVNINITLIFARARYEQVMEAYLSGLEQRVQQGLPVDRIGSVASFFVSRVDTKVDKLLEAIVQEGGPRGETASQLLGQAGIANARLAYQDFKRVFSGDRFARLRDKGARLQRPLWASTSTKNPAYSEIMYVQELIGSDTVDTVPLKTMQAFLDHGEVRLTIEENIVETREKMASLASLGISLEQVTQELEEEGVAAFAKSHEALMEAIGKHKEQWQAGDGKKSTPGRIPLPSGGRLDLQTSGDRPVADALIQMEKDRVLARIWGFDSTVWKPDPSEIANRLGWLHIAEEMESHLGQLEAFTFAVHNAGYTDVLLLGMGGSSLAPELFSRTFQVKPGLRLQVLDSTDPGAVLAFSESLDPQKSLFIVSTKSGGTVETLSFFKYFYNWVKNTVGPEKAGEHFVAITDPGSSLADLARRYGFRATFLNDPEIGGRFSALSYFGLVPAALCGVDLTKLLDNAKKMMRACRPEVPVRENPAAQLGVWMGEQAKNGKDKVTLVLPAGLSSFGDWVEQLIAESTGKEGRGILPVVGEPLGPPAVYGQDRVFVHISLEDDARTMKALADLEASGFPILKVHLQDIYDLAGQFFLWELATAVAGYRLGINPFDQPNVESAKKRAREMVAAYQKTGRLPEQTPQISQEGIAVYGPDVIKSLGVEWQLGGRSPGEALAAFLSQAKEGDYIALQAFIEPNDENWNTLQDMRIRFRDRYHLATTAGFGPRFLHSTGQLHKGDAGKGLFLQFTSDPVRDTPIPDEAGSPSSTMSFGVLKLAQAMGDRQALLDAERRVLRFHLTGDTARLISRLASILG